MGGSDREPDLEQEAERSRGSRSMRVARAVVGIGRGMARLIPTRLRQKLDDRLFYSIFNLTRVTNDNYGWRPRPEDNAENKDPDDDDPLR